MIGLFLVGAAMAGPVSLDRVDLLSENPGTWIHYEALTFGTYSTRPILRFVTQVQPVWDTPWEGVRVGVSIASQAVTYEAPLVEDKGLYWSGGVQTVLLMPRGFTGGLAWRWKALRVGAGVSAVSAATWVRPGGWAQWTVLPTVGVGLVRQKK